MARVARILLLGIVATGIALALATGTSAGRPLGQTGYGSDTVPPSELEIGQPVSGTGTSDDGGSNLPLILGGGVLVIVVAGGGAYAFSKAKSQGWD